MTQQFPSWVNTQEEWTQGLKQITARSRSRQRDSSSGSRGKPSARQRVNREAQRG